LAKEVGRLAGCRPERLRATGRRRVLVICGVPDPSRPSAIDARRTLGGLPDHLLATDRHLTSFAEDIPNPGLALAKINSALSAAYRHLFVRVALQSRHAGPRRRIFCASHVIGRAARGCQGGLRRLWHYRGNSGAVVRDIGRPLTRQSLMPCRSPLRHVGFFGWTDPDDAVYASWEALIHEAYVCQGGVRREAGLIGGGYKMGNPRNLAERDRWHRPVLRPDPPRKP